MAVITNTFKKAGCYLGESAALNIINKEATILSGSGALDAGTVLGRIVEGGTQTVAAAAAGAGNVGNGTVGSLTGDAGAKPGTYRITIIEPATDAGTFAVEDPDGVEVGTGTVGVAFNGPINFTLADGSTDFSAGDFFTVAVSYATSGKYAPHDPAGTDGRETAAAILYDTVDATSGDAACVVTRQGPATIFDPYLTYKTGISDADKAAARTALEATGMSILTA